MMMEKHKQQQTKGPVRQRIAFGRYMRIYRQVDEAELLVFELLEDRQDIRQRKVKAFDEEELQTVFDFLEQLFGKEVRHD